MKNYVHESLTTQSLFKTVERFEIVYTVMKNISNNSYKLYDIGHQLKK